MAHLSVVIPVYQAQECVEELYKRLSSEVSSITQDYEIVLVEDRSNDNTWPEIEKVLAKDTKVRALRLSRNFGQHNAITAGIDVCDGDWVVVMDCDLQDRPEEIPRLYAAAQKGYDIVLAARKNRQDTWWKVVLSKIFFYVFNFLTDLQYSGDVGNFRILSRRVIEAIRPMQEHLRFFGGLVQWVGFRTTTIEVAHGRRHAGETSYTMRKMMSLATSFIVAYSDKPLRLAIRLGAWISVIAVVFGVFHIARGLFWGAPVAGWTTLIVSIYFLSGIIIAILGVLGLYLGKTFDEVKRRPLYVVDERKNFPS